MGLNLPPPKSSPKKGRTYRPSLSGEGDGVGLRNEFKWLTQNIQ